MVDYTIHQKIGKYNIGVVFLFDGYDASSFKKDFQEIIDYQNKKSFSEDKDDRDKELDLKLYKQFNGKQIPKITYEFFKQKSFEVFSKFFLFMMKDNLSLATSEEFNIQFKVLRVPNRDYYFSYGEEDLPSDPENACFVMSGSWLIHSIVLPSVLGTSNFTLIQRYMLHELTHHYDKMKGYDYFNSKYEDKIKKFYLKKSAFFLNCLYTSLFNLREEGLADFNARKDSSKIDINMEGVKTYNANLLKLSTLNTKKESEPFYETQIGWGNLTPSNEYIIGRNICLTIAMAQAKKLNKTFSIIVSGQKYSSRDVSINSLLSNNNIIYISDLDSNAINSTIEIVRPLAHYVFLKEYEKACDELGISEDNRIMTRRKFYNIVRDSIERLKKEKISRLKSKGFKYLEEEIKPN
ncbi:MAG: hypothetical protein ACP5N1_02850 [Candidatus Woesearchaeota archaeon]